MYFFFEKKNMAQGVLFGVEKFKCKVTHNYYYRVGKNFPLARSRRKKK
jgi:hypothetical protein